MDPLRLIAAEVQDHVEQGRRLDDGHQVRTLPVHQIYREYLGGVVCLYTGKMENTARTPDRRNTLPVH